MKEPIIVVGSGLAGYLFAKEFRQYNKERPLYIITMSDGRFYSKPLLSTALTHKKSIQALALADANTMSQQLSAKIITNTTVTRINAKEKMITYENHHQKVQQAAYGDLILACGATVLQPVLEGGGVKDLVSVNTIEDYERFRAWILNKKKLCILGAGLVGCEFANDLINNDYQVTIIAPETHPLARFVPQPIGQMLVGALAEKGLEWQLGHFAKAIDRNNSGYQLILDDEKTLSFDGVMSAIGIRPQLKLAKTAGIKTNIGIMVNSQLRSSDPHIFALGDCAEIDGQVRQYVAPLLQSARTLTKVLIGEKASLKLPIMPIVIKIPACPVVAVPPPAGVKGEWYYHGEDGHLKAEFRDSHNQLLGFALLGNTVQEKAALIKQMSQ